MTHENGFLMIHVKRGTFDYHLDGTLTVVQWANIMLQVMERMKHAAKGLPEDMPFSAGTFNPEGYSERLKKKLQ